MHATPPPWQQVFTSFVARGQTMHLQVTGVRCTANCRGELRSGWNGCNQNIFVARIWFLRALAQHWKSTAGIQKSLMRRIERFLWAVIQRRWNLTSEATLPMCGRLLVELL